MLCVLTRRVCSHPPSLQQGYYQESGRAGRDGLPSTAVLLYRAVDWTKLGFYTANVASPDAQAAIAAGLGAMRSYAASGRCRRATLLAHFGEALPADYSCGAGCDNCAAAAAADAAGAGGGSQGGSQGGKRDLGEPARLLLAATSQTGNRYGAGAPIAVLLGQKSKAKGHDTAPVFGRGAGKGRTEKWWKTLHSLLVEEKLLTAECKTTSAYSGGRGGAYVVFRVSPDGHKLLASHDPLVLAIPPEMRAEEGAGGAGGGGGRQRTSGGGGGGGTAARASVGGVASPAPPASPPSPAAAGAVSTALRAWRYAVSRAEGKPAYCYLSDALLEEVSRVQPATAAELAAIKGIGPNKAQGDHGRAILEAVASAAGGGGGDGEGDGAPSAPPRGGRVAPNFGAGPASAADGTPALSPQEETVLAALIDCRARLAAARRPPIRAEHLIEEPALRHIAYHRPASLRGPAGLEGVPGVNDFVLNDCGSALLQCVRTASHAAGLGLDVHAAAMAAEADARRARAAAATAAALAMVAAVNGDGAAGGGGAAATAGGVTLGASRRASAGGKAGSLTAPVRASLIAWRAGARVEDVAARAQPKPLATSTVVGHLIAAAEAGCDLDWARLGEEVGATGPNAFPGLGVAELLAAVAAAKAEWDGASPLRLSDVRLKLQPGVADAADTVSRGASWGLLRFAVAMADHDVEVRVTPPPSSQQQQQQQQQHDAAPAAAGDGDCGSGGEGGSQGEAGASPLLRKRSRSDGPCGGGDEGAQMGPLDANGANNDDAPRRATAVERDALVGAVARAGACGATEAQLRAWLAAPADAVAAALVAACCDVEVYQQGDRYFLL